MRLGFYDLFEIVTDADVGETGALKRGRCLVFGEDRNKTKETEND